MKQKRIIELINSIVLIIYGVVILTLPVLQIHNPKYILLLMLIIYGLISLFKFIMVYKSKDYDGLFTFLASVITIILMFIIDVNSKPFKLAFVLLIWIVLMSLIKLKKSDYYHDRKNKEWIIKVISLVLFIIAGLLTSINLYNVDFQVLVLGFFFLIHGILELFEPLTIYVK